MNFLFSIFAFFNLGGGEIFVIFLAILIFFGSKNIPAIARNLGKALRELRNATNDIKREISESVDSIDEINNDKNIDKKI